MTVVSEIAPPLPPQHLTTTARCARSQEVRNVSLGEVSAHVPQPDVLSVELNLKDSLLIQWEAHSIVIACVWVVCLTNVFVTLTAEPRS
jgi:hypothetical protein